VNVTTLGIDLAKNVFRVHGVDGNGRTVVKRQLRRRQVLLFMAQNGIERDEQQLAHAGDQRHLGSLAGIQQTAIKVCSIGL
jgi:hypothetical protein